MRQHRWVLPPRIQQGAGNAEPGMTGSACRCLTALAAGFSLNQMIKIALNWLATMLTGPIEFNSVVLIVPRLPSRFPSHGLRPSNHLGFRQTPLTGTLNLRATGAPGALLQVADLSIPCVAAGGATAVGSRA